MTKRKRIALVGGAQSTQSLAPYDDDAWEIWSLASHAVYVDRADVWFEIHEGQDWSDDYTEFLRSESRVIAHPSQAERIGAEAYPYSLARGLAGGSSMLTSTLDHMMALAIAKRPKEIGLWGFDLCDHKEYRSQREGFRFWQGVAISRGIKLTIAERSALFGDLPLYGSVGFVSGEADLENNSFTELLASVIKQSMEAAEGKYKAERDKRKVVSGWAYMTNLIAENYQSFLRGQDVSNNIKVVDDRVSGKADK